MVDIFSFIVYYYLLSTRNFKSFPIKVFLIKIMNKNIILFKAELSL